MTAQKRKFPSLLLTFSNTNTNNNTMKYASYALRVLLALTVLAMPLSCFALYGYTQDYAFLLPMCLSFFALLAVTELDKAGYSRMLHWFSRPL